MPPSPWRQWSKVLLQRPHHQRQILRWWRPGTSIHPESLLPERLWHKPLSWCKSSCSCQQAFVLEVGRSQSPEAKAWNREWSRQPRPMQCQKMSTLCHSSASASINIHYYQRWRRAFATGAIHGSTADAFQRAVEHNPHLDPDQPQGHRANVAELGPPAEEVCGSEREAHPIWHRRALARHRSWWGHLRQVAEQFSCPLGAVGRPCRPWASRVFGLDSPAATFNQRPCSRAGCNSKGGVEANCWQVAQRPACSSSHRQRSFLQGQSARCATRQRRTPKEPCQSEGQMGLEIA